MTMNECENEREKVTKSGAGGSYLFLSENADKRGFERHIMV